MAQLSWAQMFYVAMGLAVAVPALLVAALPRRVLPRLLLAWFVSPVFAYVAAISWESLTLPQTKDPAGTALYGFMLISPILGPPWAVACLLGVGLGAVLRLALRPRRPPPLPPVAAGPVAPSTAAPLPKMLPKAPPAPPVWRSIHIGFENDGLRVGGLDVWAQKWRQVSGPSVRLAHPTHPTQMHDYDVFTIGNAANPVRFAACELSNGVWGFSIRRDDPAEAQGACQDGSLLYQHRLDGPHDSPSPTAVLIDAASGRVLADGATWGSSRIVPNADGTMFLRLRQRGFDVLFRIDPATRQFWDHGEGGPRRQLAELAAAAEQARQAILDAKGPVAYRDISPNGTIRVDLATAEWSNTHWVNSPRVVALTTGRVLLDLWDTDWDATVSFPRGACVRLDLRRYRNAVRMALEIDAARNSFRIGPSAGPEADSPMQPLDRMTSALEAASMQWAVPGHTAKRIGPSPWAAWRAALLILAASIVAIAAGTAFSLRMEEHDAGLTPAPAELPNFELTRPNEGRAGLQR